MKEYLALLDKKHNPPHRLKRLRIIQVFMDGAMLEFKRIVEVSYCTKLFCVFLSNTNHV